MPGARRRTLTGLVAAMAAGDLEVDAGADWNRARAQLSVIPGIGPWTTEVIAMRGFGDPDAFPVTDLGVRAAAKAVGLPEAHEALLAHS